MKTFAAIAFAIAIALATTVSADTNIDMDEAIDVSANFSKPEVSGSDRLKQVRAKLEKRNEMVVKEQIEKIRFNNEVELAKKTQQAFNQMMNNLEQVQ